MTAGGRAATEGHVEVPAEAPAEVPVEAARETGNDPSPETLARRARAAFRTLPTLATATKRAAFEELARALGSEADSVLEANAGDVAAARERGTSGAMLDRLALDRARLEGMASSVLEIAALPDPVGEMSDWTVRPNGLRVGKMRIPLGVVAMIYEARPNVTTDAAALCLLSGNAVILRGGSEAARSNRALTRIVRGSLQAVGIPPDAVQSLAPEDRGAVRALIQLEGCIDLVIPRGGEGLIREVVAHSRVPVLKHYKGVCHLYVDETADEEMAVAIALNAKTQRPGVCNTIETLLIHRAAAPTLLPRLAEALEGAGVELRGCERSRELAPGGMAPATEADWAAEYLDKILAVRVVDHLDEAIEHIDRWGSDHTEAIVTRDDSSAREFLARVQSSTVLVNASTRFADGGELGLGAEIGISTSKLHAFGPMGARELTTTKFVVFGDGQIRGG